MRRAGSGEGGQESVPVKEKLDEKRLIQRHMSLAQKLQSFVCVILVFENLNVSVSKITGLSIIVLF